MTSRGYVEPTSVVINGIYRAQRMSGQQRYAAGIVERLKYPSVRVREPMRPFAGNAVARHLWTNLVFARSEASASLSLTHQIPLVPIRARHEVITIHDLFVLTNPEWYGREFSAYAARILRAGARRAEQVIAVSEVVAEQIRDELGVDQPISVVPGAPADVFFQGPAEADTAVLRRFGVRAGHYFVTLAADDPRKRLSLILEAHEQSALREVPLVVAGRAPAVTARDNAYGNSPSESVIVRGWISDDELAALYRHAAAFITASEAEGFGLPAVEAATAGAPVIASRLAIHEWTLGKYPTYFAPGDRDELVQALDAVGNGAPRTSYDRRFSFASSAAIVDSMLFTLT